MNKFDRVDLEDEIPADADGMPVFRKCFEHETLMSFYDDDGNYKFREWWSVLGSYQFQDWISTLKPCPFCGSEAKSFQREVFGSDHDHSLDKDNWDVLCTNNTCYLHNGADWWFPKEIAIEMWNRRQDASNEK